MKNLQLISFEVTDKCNMSHAHPWCPSNRESRYTRVGGFPATDEQFISFLNAAMSEGFAGLVGFHYYCEPTLDIERCKRLAHEIHDLGLRTLLWTNDPTQKPDGNFDEVNATDYSDPQNLSLNNKPFEHDDRLNIYGAEPIEAENYLPCYRPAILEMPIDFYGEVHLCCGDWGAEVDIGNIRTDNHLHIISHWRAAGKLAKSFGFELCHRCRGLARSPALDSKEYKL
jgi:hypothetical protein